MTLRQAAICLALTLLLPGSVFSQSVSEQQLDYLREEFLRNVTNTLSGLIIEIGTLPTDRIDGLIPANKIIEADPIWSSVSNLYYPASNPSNFLTGYTETDPIWSSVSNLYYPASNPSNFLTGYTETDPIFTNWLATNVSVVVETDPIFTNWLATNTGSTGTVSWVDEQYFGSSVSSNILTLSNTPPSPESVFLAVNSGVQRLGSDFTVSGDEVTFSFGLATNDIIHVRYDMGAVGMFGANLAGITTNLAIPLVGQTITLYIANGLITNAVTGGP